MRPKHSLNHNIKSVPLVLTGNSQLNFSDMLNIGRQQIADEDEMARTANRWLICDTSPLTTMFYSDEIFGAVDSELALLATRHYDYALLCMPDIAFVQDGTRQNEAFRDRQHEWYCERLAELCMPHLLVSGTLGNRLEQAISVLEECQMPPVFS